VNLAIIGDNEVEKFFDKVDTKDNYKLAQLNGKNCAFLCSNNGFTNNLKVLKSLNIDKVFEITENGVGEDSEVSLSLEGIEYSGILVKGEKSCVKFILSGILAGVSDRKNDLLSEREREVLVLVARGMTNRDIAKNLFLSEKTVKNHLNNIFKKIEVTDRTKAALYAINNNIN
jgi:DNA-binding CsgD family transcriptional regulator